MPRGKKKSALQNIEEQIEKIDSDIEKCQDKIDELKSKKKELLDSKEHAELEALYAKVKASGKTIDDVLNALESKEE
jgi:phage shock protein A